MELENRDGDDLTSGDHLESVKRDSDSDTPPDQGKLVRFLFANKIEHFPQDDGTGGVKDEAIKDLGESLGLNNWQTVAAIIGATLKWEMLTFKFNL